MQAPAFHVQIREVGNGLYFRVTDGGEQFTGTPDGQAAAAIAPLLDRLPPPCWRNVGAWSR